MASAIAWALMILLALYFFVFPLVVLIILLVQWIFFRS